jgi:small-conductance mechanosensitive channel
MPLSWHRLVTVAVVLLVTVVIARLTDTRMARRDLMPETATRYRVLRRSITSVIIAIGLLSALLVIPQIRAAATGILASSAVVGIIIGFASQRTIGNFVAGLLIAISQPIRLGDRIEIEETIGTVEEIALSYTFIRTDEGVRLVIPNEKLASDTIRNSTIISPNKVAEITLQVPLDKDLGAVVDLLRETAAAHRNADVAVTALDDTATIAVRLSANGPIEAERLENELRIRAHERLRAAGVFE